MDLSDGFGEAISREPHLTLASYLGAAWAVSRSQAKGIAFPQEADFRADASFDPNPHRLALPDDNLRTTFLVKTLTAWGWEPLVRAAVTASQVQAEAGSSSRSEKLVEVRGNAAEAARAFLAAPSERTRALAREAAAACLALYAPYENRHTKRGEVMWYALGAAWFAAETAAQDYSLSKWDGLGPTLASRSWRARGAVWPGRALEAAAKISSHEAVRQRVRNDLLAWLQPLVDVR